MFFCIMNSVELALKIAVEAHQGQIDRTGEPYILHPLAVGLMGQTDEERAAGFLHDVIEDSEWTAEGLLQAGVKESVVSALQLLTHTDDLTYDEYIQRIMDSQNPIALKVKFNDLTHNYKRGKAFPDLQLKHGAALKKISEAVEAMNRVVPYDVQRAKDTAHEVAVFAAGCFWGVQHYMKRQPGVLKTYVGYTGGTEEHPTYEQVRSQRTRHLEAVLVEYDPCATSFDTLCRLFFEIHDPGQSNGQGPDIGSQYLSAIFVLNGEQAKIADKLIKVLRERGHEVCTSVRPLQAFWVAENYHQNYYENTGGSPYCHVRISKFPKTEG